jgi:hypothetical protein
MKPGLFALVVVLLSSCASGPFINYTLMAERVGNDCSKATGQCNVDANTAGERYTFDYCLKDGFDEKSASMERRGDTMVLNLPEPSEGDTIALYKLTLDLDTDPKYNHIQLGDKTVIDVSVTGN